MANLLTLLRLLCVIPFGLSMRDPTPGAARVSAFLLALAVATDLLDGWQARRAGSTRPATQAFDHTTDFLFVTTGLGAAALREAVPRILPLCILVAFVQYVIDSYAWQRGDGLRTNRLGRANGILYFLPLVGDILTRTGVAPLSGAVRILAWGLVFTTLASMADRWRWLSRTRRRAPDSRSEGTRARARR